MRYASRIVLYLAVVFIALPYLLWGQENTGTIMGTITDPSSAVISGAQVTITDASTGASWKGTTTSVGTYVFSRVKPGFYDLKVAMAGFRQALIPKQEVVVGQLLTINVTLEVGSTTQMVEVTASAGSQLQTLNAAMGSTLGGEAMLTLPNQNRDATTLLLFQPTVAPTFGGAEGNVTGGQVAGAMSDQNTFTLDGGNATDDLAGDNGYVSGNRGYVGPQAAIPTPVESIEEFKVSTNNQTADAVISSGGQIMLVTKRGTNSFHGSAYDYFQDQLLDAAGWNLDSTYGAHLPKVKQHQNRMGGAIGGPMLPGEHLGGKTYFYANYEGRRYPYANGRFERTVPSDALKAGYITEEDTSGNLIQYDMKTSMACGPNGGVACDPRGIGLNPIINQLWTQYEPEPNDCAGYGDHRNTCGYYGVLSIPISDNFVVGRIDHDFGSKWRFTTSYRYYQLQYPSTNQVDIGGVEPGDTKGVLKAQSSNPSHPRYFVAGLTGNLTPTVTNEFHLSLMLNDWQWKRAGVPTGLFGIPGGLEVGGETTNPLAPMNFDTQDARFRTWDGHDWTYADNLDWLKGKHFFQFGGRVNHNWENHVRPDNVTGSLTQLVYQINTQGSLLMDANNRPMNCSGPNQTGCMDPGFVGNWNGTYSEVLGIVGSAEQLFVRGGSNFALTGAPYLQDHVINQGYSVYITDAYKVKPNVTVSYGLEWGVQLPPYEESGVQDVFTDASGNPVVWQNFVDNQIDNSLNGNVYNPIVGYEPIRGVGGHPKYPYSTYWGAFSPRASIAWNPAFDSGILNKIFGNKKSVIRAGYGRIADRTNGVNNALTPLLGYGFGQPIRCSGMTSAGACLNATASTTPADAFRIGTDGNVAPFPAVSQTLPVPAEPGINAPGASVLFSLDPAYRPGINDQIDFSVQRELPGNMILEVGYTGRWAKHLYLGTDLDGVPSMLTVGGQTFANAYNALYQANLKGTAVAPQPFFENALAGSPYCKGYASCSAAVLANEGSSGTQNITYYSPYSVFADLDTGSPTGGGLWNFGNCQGCSILPADLQHYAGLNDATTAGWANYQAMVFNLQKRTGHGLTLNVNATYSHSLDTIGINQEYVEDSPNYPYNLHYDYGPAPWDRRWAMNILGTYQLPFGKGMRFATNNSVLDRIIGGWTFSPIWTAATGTPIETYTGSCQELGQNPNIPWCSGEIPLVNTGTFGHSPQIDAHSTGTVTVPGPTYGAFVGSNNDPYPDCGGSVCTPNSYGANLFKNAAAVYNSFRPNLLGVDTTARDLGAYYGQHRWNLDFTIAKSTKITERVGTTFYAQFLNALNHMEYGDPGMNFLDPADFGTLTGQYNSARVIELGLRVYF